MNWRIVQREESTRLYELGNKEFRTGNIAEVIKFFEESIGLFPHFKTLERLGDCYAAVDRYADAMVALAAATTLNRGVRVPFLLMELQLKLDDLHSAKKLAKIILERSPGHARAVAVLEIPSE